MGRDAPDLLPGTLELLILKTLRREVGLVGAFGVGRFVRGMLIQTSPNDPLTLVSISIVLTFVALTAAFRPARRATQLDPVRALRYE